jgi:hypothetical protein
LDVLLARIEARFDKVGLSGYFPALRDQIRRTFANPSRKRSILARLLERLGR